MTSKKDLAGTDPDLAKAARRAAEAAAEKVIAKGPTVVSRDLLVPVGLVLVLIGASVTGAMSYSGVQNSLSDLRREIGDLRDQKEKDHSDLFRGRDFRTWLRMARAANGNTVIFPEWP